MPGSFEPRPRRAASNIDGPLQQRARQCDAGGMASRYTYTYTPAQMLAWRDWYRDTLLDGRRWFAHALPGRSGMVQRVVRYTSVQQQLLGAGIYRVSASFEQRGGAVMPSVPPPLPVIFQTVFDGASSADVSPSMLGSGTKTGGELSNNLYLVTLLGSASDRILRYIAWNGAPLHQPDDGARTYEVILTVHEQQPIFVPSAYVGLIDIYPSTDGDARTIRLGINGGVGGGSQALAYSDTADPMSNWTDSVDGRFRRIHFALSAGLAGYRVFIDGVLVSGSSSNLMNAWTSAGLLLGGWVAAGDAGRSQAVSYYGARVTAAELYTENFTPPYTFPPL